MEHRWDSLNRLLGIIGRTQRLCCSVQFGNLPSVAASDAAKPRLGRLR
jgi:hypothetical protein